MFTPTHLFISKEKRKFEVDLLQETKNFIFKVKDSLDKESIVDFDFNTRCCGKTYLIIQIKVSNNRIYIPIDRMMEISNMLGKQMRAFIDTMNDESFI